MNGVRNSVCNGVTHGVTRSVRNGARRNVQNQNQNQSLSSYGFLLCGSNRIRSNGYLGRRFGFGAKQ